VILITFGRQMDTNRWGRVVNGDKAPYLRLAPDTQGCRSARMCDEVTPFARIHLQLSLSIPSRKKAVLNLSHFHGHGTRCVVIRCAVDPSA
jgi:hypothetical protein